MRSALVALLSLAACGPPAAPSHVPDAGPADAAAPDAVSLQACDGPGEECPQDARFCCVYCLECGSDYCVDTPGDTCNESPPPGTAQACATSLPTGCPGDRPYCCAENDGAGTWCVDHLLLGDYTCVND